MALLRDEHNRIVANAPPAGAAARFLQTDPHAVEQPAGPAESEHPGRRFGIVADQLRRHRGRAHLRFGHADRTFVAA